MDADTGGLRWPPALGPIKTVGSRPRRRRLGPTLLSPIKTSERPRSRRSARRRDRFHAVRRPCRSPWSVCDLCVLARLPVVQRRSGVVVGRRAKSHRAMGSDILAKSPRRRPVTPPPGRRWMQSNRSVPNINHGSSRCPLTRHDVGCGPGFSLMRARPRADSTVCLESAMRRDAYAGGNGPVARGRQASSSYPGWDADRGPAGRAHRG
jgi:hypothetical protein